MIHIILGQYYRPSQTHAIKLASGCSRTPLSPISCEFLYMEYRFRPLRPMEIASVINPTRLPTNLPTHSEFLWMFARASHLRNTEDKDSRACTDKGRPCVIHAQFGRGVIFFIYNCHIRGQIGCVSEIEGAGKNSNVLSGSFPHDIFATFAAFET